MILTYFDVYPYLVRDKKVIIVEAMNSAPCIHGHLYKGRQSQWCNRLRRINRSCGRSCFMGKDEQRKGGEEPRIAHAIGLQGKGAGRLLG